LEIIGRAADTKYAESTNIQLHHKIEIMLDCLFELTGFKRVAVTNIVEELSDSDADY
jgi:hypothetical protein